VYFTNESLDQADVYAISSGSSAIRIGTVMPGRTDTLRVPQMMVSRGDNVNFYARLLARSGIVQSGLVAVHPGDEFDIRLGSDLKILAVLPAR
jgi:hypothetical protein